MSVTHPVVLTKDRPKISLTKHGGATGRLRVNLNWSSGARRSWWRPAKGIDLDLGCLWELTDGRKGVVQALGDSFGSQTQAPYVFLDGDDRSGGSAGGENLWVNLEHSAEIRRLLVFAYIYDGTPSFDAAQGVVTIIPAAGPSITVRLDETAGRARTCAIALITNHGGELEVQREVRFIDGVQRKLDATYSWGLAWQPGHKH